MQTRRIRSAGPLTGAAAALWLTPAYPHAVCGDRIFPATLAIDDPGVTDELTFQASDPAGWYDLPFSSPLDLASGDYWLGVISGPQPGVAAFAYEPVADVRADNANTYATGPSDPFGPIFTDNAQMSLYLAYNVAGPSP